MTLEKNDYKLESKKSFLEKIENHYTPNVQDKIPKSILHNLYVYLSNYQYNVYKDFRLQYPKSKDRYSSFKIKDLQYLFTQYCITNFLKEKDLTNYRLFSKIILQMTEDEFIEYEIKKHQYDTK